MIDGAEVLRTLLKADIGVTGIISDRIWAKVFPPATFTARGADAPAITIDQISGARAQTHSVVPTLFLPRCQVNCWAWTRAQAVALSDAVEKALDAYRGTVGSVAVQSIVIEDNSPDDYRPDTQLFHIPLSARLALTAA